MRLLSYMAVGLALALAAPAAYADFDLGNFDPTEEAGWGYWSGGFNSGQDPGGELFTVSTDQSTTGTSSAKITAENAAVNSLAYNAGFAFGNSIQEFLDHSVLEFDVIFEKDVSTGGFQNLRQVSFNFGGGFQGLVTPTPIFQQGWGDDGGDPTIDTHVESFALDYTSLAGWNPSVAPGFLQVIWNVNQQVAGTTNEAMYIDNVRLTGPDPDPTVVSITGLTGNGTVTNPAFTFGTWDTQPAVFDFSGDNLVINDTYNPGQQPANGGVGYGFGASTIDFDAPTHALEVEARLLGDNAADRFRVILSDVDGDDSGPGLGTEDYIYFIDTSEFNTSTFETLTIPLGTGTEDGVQKQFGIINDGDFLQNFDLDRIAIQSLAEDINMNPNGKLAIEIASVRIVPFTAPPKVPGDANGDGNVDLLDLDILGQNFGLMAIATCAEGDFNDDGNVDLLDLDILGQNFGFMSGPSTSVPEPTALALATIAACSLIRRRS